MKTKAKEMQTELFPELAEYRNNRQRLWDAKGELNSAFADLTKGVDFAKATVKFTQSCYGSDRFTAAIENAHVLHETMEEMTVAGKKCFDLQVELVTVRQKIAEFEAEHPAYEAKGLYELNRELGVKDEDDYDYDDEDDLDEDDVDGDGEEEEADEDEELPLAAALDADRAADNAEVHELAEAE